MLMGFSPVTLVDFWVNCLPKNTLSPLLENELGKSIYCFYQTHYNYSIWKLYFHCEQLILSQIYNSR